MPCHRKQLNDTSPLLSLPVEVRRLISAYSCAASTDPKDHPTYSPSARKLYSDHQRWKLDLRLVSWELEAVLRPYVYRDIHLDNARAIIAFYTFISSKHSNSIPFIRNFSFFINPDKHQSLDRRDLDSHGSLTKDLGHSYSQLTAAPYLQQILQRLQQLDQLGIWICPAVDDTQWWWMQHGYNLPHICKNLQVRCLDWQSDIAQTEPILKIVQYNASNLKGVVWRLNPPTSTARLHLEYIKHESATPDLRCCTYIHQLKPSPVLTTFRAMSHCVEPATLMQLSQNLGGHLQDFAITVKAAAIPDRQVMQISKVGETEYNDNDRAAMQSIAAALGNFQALRMLDLRLVGRTLHAGYDSSNDHPQMPIIDTTCSLPHLQSLRIRRLVFWPCDFKFLKSSNSLYSVDLAMDYGCLYNGVDLRKTAPSTLRTVVIRFAPQVQFDAWNSFSEFVERSKEIGIQVTAQIDDV